MTLSLEIIRQLPKAELHCHLDGFCRPSTILELAKEQGIKLPYKDLDELKGCMSAPMECPDLVTYLRCFDAPLEVMQYPYAITRIFYEACEDASKDGIVYLELRFAPALHTRKGLSYSQILQAAIDGIHLAEKRLPLTARIICCAMRHMDPEINREVADICWRFRYAGVVAFDLAGPEDGIPPQKHISAFRTMRENSVGLTIHAGEAHGPESIEMALACNANRIGHGTHILKDERVLQYVIDRRIPMEVCITSNIQTRSIKQIQDHPIRELFDRGAICVPCTDNPTVSNTTLTEEYYKIHKTFDFGVEEIVRMIDYGFRSAFIDESLKKRLRIDAFTKTMNVLIDNNIDVSSIINNKRHYLPIGIANPFKFEPLINYPKPTLENVTRLVKIDCDTRLYGSVPLDLMYEFFNKLSEEVKVRYSERFSDFGTFKEYMTSSSHLSEKKELCFRCLQTEENIRKGIHAIIKEAIEDNVRYMELTISPLRHQNEKLAPRQIVEIVNDEILSANPEIISIKIIIYVDTEKDSPIDFQKMAELCVELRDLNVVGFATTTTEITAESMPFFQHTFDYLKANFVPVSMFAGEKDHKSIPIAITRGNCRRLSGAFQVVESCTLLREVTSYNMNIIVTDTPRLKENISTCFSKRPIRSFLDFGVKVAYGSLNKSFNGCSRSEQLVKLAHSNGLNLLDIVFIMHNTFGAMFQNYQRVRELQTKFWDETINILKELGFEHSVVPTYFVSQK